MLIYWIWFAQLGRISCGEKWQLLQRFSDPEEFYHSEAVASEDRDLTQAQQILEDCVNKGIHILTAKDESYPQRLLNTYDPPLVLYFRGSLPDWNRQPAIGIVGTRRASAYGCSTAWRFGAQIAASGALVVSGAADGIDAMAMYGALNAGKPVVGVLGCGVDVVYPKKNQEIFELTVANGCLVSEYPPRTPAYKWNFPQRNRIITGICNGLLVVEAPERSGALISANHAMEQGRDVYVVPGVVDNPCCAGSNALLQERAVAALSGWDVVKDYEALYPGQLRRSPLPKEALQVAQAPAFPETASEKSSQSDKKSIDNRDKSTYSVVNNPQPALTQEEQDVLAQIGREPRLVDELLEELSIPAGTAKAILTRLTIKGVIQSCPGGRVSRK